ncbi:MAG: EAL domain-containing protein [Actinomycetia bacterium]|nr:EAL domain-containing protein [Actinomycetes bacterium]
MNIGLTLGLVLLVATVPIGIGLGWYAWNYRSLPGALTLAVTALLAALWAVAGVGELAVAGLQNKVIWANIQYVSITLLPVSWLALAIDYSGRRRWLTLRRVLALSVIPLATQVLLWSDPYHHLMRATVWLDTTGSYPVVGRTFGPWFWVHCAYSYTLLAIAIGIIAATLVSTPYFYRRPPLALLIGCLIPVASNVAFVFAPSVMPAFDFTPVAAAFGGLLIAWALFQIRILNLVPVARHTLVENLSEGMLVLDEFDRVVDVNRSAQELIGRPKTSILSQPISQCWKAWAQIAAPHAAGANQADLCLGEDGCQSYYEVKWSPLFRHDRIVGRIVGFRDITERVLMEENLRRQTLTDSLTGLPNRTLFMSRLEESIRLARRREDAVFAVLVLDLDWFKLVNDSIGHLAGDVLLQSVAVKLTGCVREVDTVARMGGDEFMILLNSITSARDILPVIDRIQEELRRPVPFEQQEMAAACSIGVVIWNPTFEDPEDILRAADTAMYQAKEAGRGCHRIFDDEMHTSVIRMLKAENDLRTAIQQNRFSLAYQPIVHLQTSAVRSLEALIRWHHPERGTIFPGDFIAMAENSGLIAPLGEMALREVCSQMSRWQSQKSLAGDLPVSLNVSSRQVTDPEFPATVHSRLAEWRLPADRLMLDITEGALIREPLISKKTMRALHDMGVRLCLDDFGTGWSSLQHLTTFPVQQLKIDRAFISKIAHRTTSYEVVRSLITLAQTLGLEVVAEGVESSEQWRLLNELGCDYGQGYYVGRPMGPEELATYLEDMERGSCLFPRPEEAGVRVRVPESAQRSREVETPVWHPRISLAAKRTP